MFLSFQSIGCFIVAFLVLLLLFVSALECHLCVGVVCKCIGRDVISCQKNCYGNFLSFSLKIAFTTAE